MGSGVYTESMEWDTHRVRYTQNGVQHSEVDEKLLKRKDIDTIQASLIQGLQAMRPPQVLWGVLDDNPYRSFSLAHNSYASRR